MKLRELVWAAVVAALLALVLKIFVLGAFRIPSHSMEHTLLVGDQIVVSKLAYAFSEPSRGDVVVFRQPNEPGPKASAPLLIKRVVGIEGDTLRLTQTGIWVNGSRLPDPPLGRTADPSRVAGAPTEAFVVPPSMVYVVGDNRENSYDSRSWGFLPVSRIEGMPLFVYWSWADADSTTESTVRFDRLFTVIR